MALDNPNKHVGKIYLGVSNETTIEELDSMQASIRREEWNKSTQELYLIRIRAKATEKAKQILGSAYTERQKIIDLAYADAQKIKDEANACLNQAKQKHEQSRILQDDAQKKFDTAEEHGFESGLSQATEELTDFRINMGSALLNVIGAIEKQSELIFDQWRDDIVELVHICVEKSNALIISKEHAQILKNLVITSVKQLLDKRQINLYVHPDDEETVSHLFNFAKEAMPDIKHWEVHADPNLQLGDLIAECPVNALHNKHENRLTMVENILNNLSLPKDSIDKPNLDNVHQSAKEQKQKINDLVPEIETQAANDQEENPALENLNPNDIEEQNDDSQNIEQPSNDSDENSTLDLKEDVDTSPVTQEALSDENTKPITTQNSEDIPLSEPQNNNEQKNDEVNNNIKDINTNLESMDSMDTMPDIAENNNKDNNFADVQGENIPQTMNDEESTTNTSQNTEQISNASDDDLLSASQALIDAKNAQKLQAENAHKEEQDAAKKLIEDLEQELLPLPENESMDFDNSNNSAELNSVLATGGFLETPRKDNR